MARECEAKLKVDSLDAIRRKLDDLGAGNEGDCLERNWVLDDENGSLRKRGVVLRVRTMGGVGGILTVKHPVEGGGEFKTREELETMVDSYEELLHQLEVVGYVVDWVYEKHRQTWLWRDCILALDECPEIGYFVEIEGQPDRIREVAADLDLNPDDHIGESYLGLWIDHLRALGHNKRHMLFSDADGGRGRSRTEQFFAKTYLEE